MISLSSRLALSRLTTNRTGLDALAVLAFAITSWLALTVAGGTSMFISRAENPPQPFIEAHQASEMPNSATAMAQMYPALAAIACAILVIPILTLGGAAARLGASGRARRLAALRLIGMTGGEVILMSVIETLVLAAIGVVVGAVLWLVSLPAWSAIAFLGEAIHPAEMLMPAWVAASVVAVILLLAALSTVIGLQRVRISPLGVARRETTAALKWWRLAAFVVAGAVFYIVARGFELMTAALVGFLVMGGFIALLVLGINLVGPLVIQLVARPFARTKSPSRLLAMRRLISDPKGAWRNVSAVALLGVVAAFTLAMPQDMADAEPLLALQFGDVRTGAMITLAIGLVLAAASTLINQASATVDRAEQTIALTRMGTPRSVFARARVSQVMLPLVTTLLVSIPVGLLMSMPFMTPAAEVVNSTAAGIATVGGVILAGVALSLLAAWACGPIEDRILRADYRPND